MTSTKSKSRATSAPKSVSALKQFERESGVYKTVPKAPKTPKSKDKSDIQDDEVESIPVRSGKKPKPPSKSKLKEIKAAAKAHASTTWQEDLLRKTRDGSWKQSFGNAQIVLNHDPTWKDVFAYDEFIGDIVVTRKVVWDVNNPAETKVTNEWSEQDTMRLRGWLDRHYGIDLGTGIVGQVIRVVAEERRTHAVREYLTKLPKWDRVRRLDTWLTRIGGAKDDEYTRAVAAKLLIGAVARVFEPGCKNDCMVVFEGAQGAMKSTMVEVLFSRPWYSGTPFKMGTKDGYQTLRRKWGLEIPELSSFDRAGMNEIKAFLSQPEDNYRPSYGAKNVDFPRQSICIGTTNDTEWHKDTTGGRRFLPIFLYGVLPGKPKRVDIAALKEERDQLWAEAVVRYKAGEAWHLDTPRLMQLAAKHIDRRRQADPWEAEMLYWLSQESPTKGVTRWQKYCVGRPETEFMSAIEPLGLGTSDVLLAANEGKFRCEGTRADEMRAGAVLRALGFERVDLRWKAPVGGRYKYLPTSQAKKTWETYQASLQADAKSEVEWRGPTSEDLQGSEGEDVGTEKGGKNGVRLTSLRPDHQKSIHVGAGTPLPNGSRGASVTRLHHRPVRIKTR